MSIVSHGIDLVDFPRIESMIERHGARFLNRVFTQREQSDAEAAYNRIEKLAGRFAGKEAVMKLLGTGWRGKIAWTDIEIVNSAMGQPVVEISGEVRRIAEARAQAEYRIAQNVMAHILNDARRGGAFARMSRR